MAATPVRATSRVLTCPGAPARGHNAYVLYSPGQLHQGRLLVFPDDGGAGAGPRHPPAQLRPARREPVRDMCPPAPKKSRATRRGLEFGDAARGLDFGDEMEPAGLRAPPRIRRYRTLDRVATSPRALNFGEPQCPPAPRPRVRHVARTPLAELSLTDADFE
jgi:hypothetical protein